MIWILRTNNSRGQIHCVVRICHWHCTAHACTSAELQFCIRLSAPSIAMTARSALVQASNTIESAVSQLPFASSFDAGHTGVEITPCLRATRIRKWEIVEGKTRKSGLRISLDDSYIGNAGACCSGRIRRAGALACDFHHRRRTRVLNRISANEVGCFFLRKLRNVRGSLRTRRLTTVCVVAAPVAE